MHYFSKIMFPTLYMYYTVFWHTINSLILVRHLNLAQHLGAKFDWLLQYSVAIMHNGTPYRKQTLVFLYHGSGDAGSLGVARVRCGDERQQQL